MKDKTSVEPKEKKKKKNYDMRANKTISTVLSKSLQEIASSWLEISNQKLDLVTWNYILLYMLNLTQKEIVWGWLYQFKFQTGPNHGFPTKRVLLSLKTLIILLDKSKDKLQF